MIDAASPLSEDMLEALSSRYTDAARVLLLSSARWAVFDGLASGGSVLIVESKDELPAAIAARCRAARAEYESEVEGRAENRARTGQGLPLPLVSDKSVDDLGL